MKRERRLTKRERKSIERAASTGGGHHDHGGHIHCVACGRHLDPGEFDAGTATVVSCAHKSNFPSCTGCVTKAKELLDEHDRSGGPVKTASAWH